MNLIKIIKTIRCFLNNNTILNERSTIPLYICVRRIEFEFKTKKELLKNCKKCKLARNKDTVEAKGIIYQ